MKASQATQKIKDLKTTYVIKLSFCYILIFLFFFIIYFFYLTSFYFAFPWSEFISKTFKFISKLSPFYKSIFSICFGVILLINLIILDFIAYYVANNHYQNFYTKYFFDELALNEIYLEEDNHFLSKESENIYHILHLDNYERYHLYSLKSVLEISLTQLYQSIHKKKNRGILINVHSDIFIDGFLQIRFDDYFAREAFEDKNIFQFYLQDKKKLNYPLYINSNLKQKTYTLVDERVRNLINELRKFTKSNFSITLYKNNYFIYIENWELNLANSLMKKLHHDDLDQKIEALSDLVYYIIDIYVLLKANNEVIKNGK